MKFRVFALLVVIASLLSACTTTVSPNLPTPQVIPLADVDQARALWENSHFTSYMIAVEETRPDTNVRVRVIVKDGVIDSAIIEDILSDGSYTNARSLPADEAANYTVDALFDRVERDVLGMGPALVNLDVVFSSTFGFPTIIEADPIATMTEDGKLSLNRSYGYSIAVELNELLEDIFGLTKEPVLVLHRTGGEQPYCDTLRVYADRTSLYSDECNQLLLQIDPPLSQFSDLETLRAGFASLSETQSLPGDGQQSLTVSGSGAGSPNAADLDALWKLADDMMTLLSKPVGDGLTLIYTLNNNLVGVDMIGFTSQGAALNINGTLHGALVPVNSDLIVYADDGGVYTLSLDTGSNVEALLSPPDEGYYQLRHANSDVVIISQVFDDNTTTLGWSYLDRRRFREVPLPSGGDTYGCDAGVAISPVANLLVISGSSTSAECNRVPGLTVVNLEDGTVDRILTEATAFSPAWSPDGSQIAFARVEGNTSNLYVVNADGSGLQALTTFTTGGVNSLAWGQNHTLFYGRTNAENPDEDGIFMLEIDKQQSTQLVFGTDVYVRSVAPDGNHMAFYETDGDFKVMVVPFSQVVPILQGVGPYVNFGGWIANDTP